METKNQKITKNKDLFAKIPTETKFGYTSPEQPLPPREHLLHVYMTGGRLLVPNTTVYKQYDGLETGALASCTGVALYIPHGENCILGIGHLAPSQNPYSLVKQFREQLRETGIDFHRFQQQRGFMEVVPGQTTYSREKGNLRDGISALQDYLKKQFPNLTSFPARQVSYSVLGGHLSSGVKLLKGGQLIISGEGKAY